MSKRTARGLAAPISVSQNFLTCKRTIDRLLRLTSICGDDYVIEIGAGKGHITKELAKVSRAVSAYEIDPRLYGQLQKALGGADNVKLMLFDFIKASLPEHGRYKVFSNIPFSITSPIVRKLTTDGNPPQDAWLVVEKGAAKRFIGKPGETLASIAMKPFFDARIAYYFSRQDFHPTPSVDVVLLHLKKKVQPDIAFAQRERFAAFVESGSKYGLQRALTKKQITAALRLAGLPRIGESGPMLYVQWLCLFRCYQQFMPAGSNG